MTDHDDAVKAAAEAIREHWGGSDFFVSDLATRAVAAAAPILLAAERQRIAEAIREVADSDGQWIGPADPDSVIRMVARRVAEADL